MNNKLKDYLTYQIIKLFLDNKREIKFFETDGKNGIGILVKKQSYNDSLYSAPKGFFVKNMGKYFKFCTFREYNFPFLQTVMLANFYAWALLRFHLKDSVL